MHARNYVHPRHSPTVNAARANCMLGTMEFADRQLFTLFLSVAEMTREHTLGVSSLLCAVRVK